MNMKHLLLILFPAFFSAAPLFGQSLTVWPGDVTNNGVVNNVDFLHLGLAYNYIGPARDSVNSSWLPQQVSPWAGQFANGVNYAYADCNGDGIVNYFYDAFPIYVHYGKVHGLVTPDVFVPGTPGVDPPFQFDDSALPAQVSGGQQITLPLTLGSAALPMEDFYGIAFSIIVDRDFVDVDQVSLNFNQASWANPDNDRIFSVNRVTSERLDVGWVRIDHNEKSGYGPIGEASFIVIDDVVSVQQQFMLRIDSIRVIDRFGNQTAVAGDTLLVTVSADPTASSETPGPSRRSTLSVQPNPASDGIAVEAPETMRELILHDASGRVVMHLQPDLRRFYCPLPAVPGGLYFLQVQTDRGIYFEYIVIAH